MTRSRKPKTDTSEWVELMDRAHLGEIPQPLCHENPGPWMDYGYPLPKEHEADDLCLPCPLMAACLRNAKHRQPAFGVWGGLAWIGGRQVRLLKLDDERLIDPDLLGVSDEVSD